MKLRTGAIWLIIGALLLSVACGPKKSALNDPVKTFSPTDFAKSATVEDTKLPTPTRDASSIWFEDNKRNWLFTDHKAFAVNDVLTIQILEESTAKKKAETKTDRGSTIGAGVSGLFGLEKSMAKGNPDMNLETLIGAKFDNEFNGKGETSRTGKLVATISALVVDVLPNGNLLVRGKRVVTVNNEEEIIMLTGIVRPRDVDENNSILSTRIADAKIEYLGQGVVADKQKPGWFSRGMDAVWPF